MRARLWMMEAMGEWFENFFEGLYGQVLASQFHEARSLEQARIAKRLLKVRKGQQVLDIACGLGRLTIPMAQMGLLMTGLDLTASYIRRARRRAKQHGLDIRFIRSDMRDIAFDAEFHAAFSWFTSFGYFSDADNLSFCKRVLRALRPGGRFLVETINKSAVLAHFRPRSEQMIGRVRVVQNNKWDGRSGRMRSIWSLTKGPVAERHRISLKMYNGADMRALLRAAGFRDIRLYGHPPVGRFTRHSRRLIAVARRPARA